MNIRFELFKLNTVIICIYRTPDGGFNYFIEACDDLLNNVPVISKTNIISGDVNVNILENNLRTKQVLNLFNSYNFGIAINEVTRKTNYGAIYIDNFITNINENNYTQVFNPCISDHYCISISCNFTNKNVNTVGYSYSTKNTALGIHDLKSKLSQLKWTEIYKLHDSTLAFNLFLRYFYDIFCSCFSIKKIRITADKKKNLYNGLSLNINN